MTSCPPKLACQQTAHLRSETLSYVDVDGIGPMTMKSKGEIPFVANQRIYLSPEPGHLHVFNGGRRVSATA